MGSPAIFAGKRSKLLSSKGLLYSNGSINDYNGDINYILNGHAEVNTTGWATYADAAQATPVDGTGGSPTVTWTQTTTSPLYDSGSFVFTKDAVNRQGQGVSYAFTIDSAAQAKVMTITFDYIVSSGTFTAGSRTTDSDLEVFIYDVTNSVLIQLSTYKLYSNSSTVASPFIANFQTPYNSTSYRLIFHCATTSASAYTLKFDNVKVSPTEYTYGTPITDWTAYTPVFTNLGTVTLAEAYWRRVGDSIQVRGRATLGTTVGATASISFPNNLVISSSTNTIQTTFGGNAVNQNQTINYSILGAFGNNYFTLGNVGSSGLSSLTGTNIGASGNILAWATGLIPIQGWSSCVQMSDSTTQQVVTAIASGTPANVTAGNPIIYPTIINDTTGSYNASTGRFTVPVAGYWQVSMSAAASVATTVPINIYKNAVQNLMIAITTTGNVTGFGTVYANAGDILDVRPVGSGITSFSATTNYNSISFTRVSGPASIAASEKIYAQYYLSANQSVTGSTTRINLDTKIVDSSGSVATGSSWAWTAPRSGPYTLTFESSTSAACGFYVYKNGSLFCMAFVVRTASDSYNWAQTFYLNAGDYFYFLTDTTTTVYGGAIGTSKTFFSVIGY